MFHYQPRRYLPSREIEAKCLFMCLYKYKTIPELSKTISKTKILSTYSRKRQIIRKSHYLFDWKYIGWSTRLLTKIYIRQQPGNQCWYVTWSILIWFSHGVGKSRYRKQNKQHFLSVFFFALNGGIRHGCRKFGAWWYTRLH